MVHIKKLRNDRNRWTWETCEHGREIQFTTNINGNGIFMITGSGYKQITGTCQFTLYGLSSSGAYKKIRRWFTPSMIAYVERLKQYS